MRAILPCLARFAEYNQAHGPLSRMTRSQIRQFVEGSSVERIREVLDLMEKLKRHVAPEQLPEKDRAFLLDLRDHEAFFRELADAKLQK